MEEWVLRRFLDFFGFRKKSLTIELLSKNHARALRDIRKVRLENGCLVAHKRGGGVFYVPLGAYHLIEVKGGGYAKKIKLPTEGGRVEGSF
jgi:hypothetical protein